jgi:hypothetical protein
VVDISCDVHNSLNPLPIYDEITSFAKPTLRVVEPDEDQSGRPPLDVIAIPTLPALVPIVSSNDFSAQLVSCLFALSNYDTSAIWQRAKNIFLAKTHCLQPHYVPRSNLAHAAPLPGAVFAQVPTTSTANFALSLTQERTWHQLVDSAQQSAEMQYISETFVIPRNLDPIGMRRAVEELIAENEVLRY